MYFYVYMPCMHNGNSPSSAAQVSITPSVILTCSCSKTQNGVECSESLEGSGGGGGQSTSSSGEVSGTVVLRATSDHRRSLSHTNRLSYMEAVSLVVALQER